MQDSYVAETKHIGSGQDDKLCRTQLTLQFVDKRQALDLLKRPRAITI